MSKSGETRVPWKVPPRVKVLEALGAVGDGRIIFTGEREAQVTGSDGSRVYRVVWDGGLGISSNDNGSVYKGYLGYPSIAFLMLKGVLPFDQRLADGLKGIPWREINEKFKNYRDTEMYVKQVLEERGFNWGYVNAFVEKVLSEIKRLRPYKLE